jgi:hypothetical protein
MPVVLARRSARDRSERIERRAQWPLKNALCSVVIAASQL